MKPQPFHTLKGGKLTLLTKLKPELCVILRSPIEVATLSFKTNSQYTDVCDQVVCFVVLILKKQVKYRLTDLYVSIWRNQHEMLELEVPNDVEI